MKNYTINRFVLYSIAALAILLFLVFLYIGFYHGFNSDKRTYTWFLPVLSLGLIATGNLLYKKNPSKNGNMIPMDDDEPSDDKEDFDQYISKLIMDATENTVLILDKDERISHFNQAALESFGYSQNELLNMQFSRLITSRSENSQGIKKNGEQFPIDIKIVSTTINGEQIQTVRIKDLTQEVIRKNQMKERSDLIENQNWLKTALAEVFDSTKGVNELSALINSVTTIICKRLDAGVGIFYLNEELGKSDVVRLKLQSSYAFKKRKGVNTEYLSGEGLVGQCALEKKTIVVADVPDDYIQIVSGMGNTTPKEIVVTPILHDDEIIGVIELGILRSWNELQLEFINEVTTSIGIIIKGVIERVKTDELAVEVNNQIQAINRSNAAIEFDLEGNILTANELFLDLFEYDLDEVLGKHHGLFVDPEYRESKEYRNFWKELAAGEFIKGEFVRFNQSGEEVWIQGSYNPIFGLDGKPYKVLKVAVDVTNQKKQQIKTEELAIEVNNQMQAINRSNASIEFDMSGNILTANELFLDLMGYSLDQIEGKHHSIFVDPHYAESSDYKSFWNELRSGKFTQGEFQRRDVHGDEIWIQGSYNPILGVDKKPYKILKIATDITKQKQFMAQMNEQNEKLEAQEEELRISNEELKSQAARLEESEETLRVQQEELAATNTELEEKASQLEEQNQSISDQNQALEQARQALEIKAAEIEESNKYKSEFLANMSHELRTPLNSILILSRFLQENKVGNLNEKQMEYAKVINGSGSDLLNLINEVLDLSKVESGKIELELEQHEIKNIANENLNNIKGLALNKNIDLSLEFEEGVPSEIRTDKQRLNQIIKNLLSNAIKFTDHHGKVGITFASVDPDQSMNSRDLLKNEKLLKITVSDTGIGIPENKLGIIFQAFKQADGSTHRKYGGTGLGLSISKELAELLGGELLVTSEVGVGSKFSIYLPFDIKVKTVEPEVVIPDSTLPEPKVPEVPMPAPKVETPPKPELKVVQDKSPSPKKIEKQLEAVVADDRENLFEDDQVLLIVEDDLGFAKILLDMGRTQGFKGLITDRGDYALEHVKRYQPDAIILDMQLPVMDGWTVLKELKASEYSNIPIHVMSALDRQKLGYELGAVEYLIKPIDPSELEKTFSLISENLDSEDPEIVLFIGDNEETKEMISNTLQQKEIDVITANSGLQGLSIIENEEPDLVIIDLGSTEMGGIDLFKKIKESHSEIPVIIFTAENLPEEDLKIINREKNASVVLQSQKSMDRLLEETELFVHALKNDSEYSIEKMNIKNFEENNLLVGKKMLVVDDDMRNIYALETILTSEEVEIVVASNGQEAVDEMNNPNQDFDAVLMDIMMPVMDGYEATRQIRKLGFDKLPIIALTAKAMKGDREKCLEAGVSDYLTKPLDVDQLLSLLRVWLYK